MTNFERYKDKIKDIMASGKDVCKEFVQPIMLKEDKCDGIACVHCGLQQMLWLMDEYKEPEVDWSKVEVDTPILVRDLIHVSWKKRYFANYEDGRVYAWCEGKTSWSAVGENDTTYWRFAKLAEEGE